MKWMAVVMAVMMAGGAVAAPLKGLQVCAGRQRPGAVAQMLSIWGVTNGATQAAMVAEWDEEVLITTGLAERSYGLVNWAMGLSPFSQQGLDRVKQALLEEVRPVKEVLAIALRYPQVEREAFRPALEAVVPSTFGDRPVYGRMYVEHTVLRGIPLFSVDVPVSNLVTVLLANETMPLDQARQCKEAIKQRAVVLARLRLRAEGKTFVTRKDGENPLANRLAPLVAALNAPLCAGLEAELRNLGVETSDVDRTALAAVAEGWQREIMSGAISGSEAGKLLGKLSIVLGPEGYNRFIDQYNNGVTEQPGG